MPRIPLKETEEERGEVKGRVALTGASTVTPPCQEARGKSPLWRIPLQLILRTLKKHFETNVYIIVQS